MSRLIILLALPLLVGISCSKQTTVSPVAHARSFPPAGFIYALPQTVLRFNVQAELTVVTPGPYASFAQKYLGIANAPQEPTAQWAIATLQVSQRAEADLAALFLCLPGKGSGATKGFELAAQGLIIPTSAVKFDGARQTEMHSQSDQPASIPFTDLSHTPFIATERTTHFTRVLQDTAFVRVPVHRNIVVERSLEEKAREAADFIFSLRQRRLDLLVGDADFIADGKAVEPILQEIQRLEYLYLSLFTGVTRTFSHSYEFDYVPAGQATETSILFRFSPTKGVLPVSDLTGSPVLITLTATNQWEGVELLNNLVLERERPRSDALYYRIPAPVSIRLSHEQSNLLTTRLLSFQHGPLVRVPANRRP